MALRLGTDTPDALYMGTTPVDAVYLGTNRAWPAPYLTELLVDDPLLVLMLDETSGAVAWDSVPPGDKGWVYLENPTLGAAGPSASIPRAMQTNGVGWVRTFQDPFLLSGATATLEFWFYRSSGGTQMLFHSGAATNPSGRSSIMIETGRSGVLSVQVRESGSQRHWAEIPQPAADQWHHLSAVVARTGTRVRSIMLNGAEQPLDQLTSGTPGTTWETTGHAGIGRRIDENVPFDGRVAGFAAYNHTVPTHRRRVHWLAGR